MLFCPLIAAFAMQAASADTTDIVVQNVRPSRIAQKEMVGLLPKSCRMEALDAEGKIRLHGPADVRQQMETYVRMFDVKPLQVAFSVQVESKIDKLDYHLDLDVPNTEEFNFTESTTGLKVGIQPRVNGDGTVTLYVAYGLDKKTIHTVVRLKQKQYYVFCSGSHGSCNVIADSPNHPAMLDPVLVISPSLKQ